VAVDNQNQKYVGLRARINCGLGDLILIGLLYGLIVFVDFSFMNRELGSVPSIELSTEEISEKITTNENGSKIRTRVFSQTASDPQKRAAKFKFTVTEDFGTQPPTVIMQEESLGTDPNWGGKFSMHLKVAGLTLAMIYFVFMWASKFQCSYGGIFSKIKITDMNGDRISLFRALIRFIALATSFSFPLVFFIIPFSKKRQGLHDMIARTVVVSE
jgi:hypothetical protein